MTANDIRTVFGTKFQAWIKLKAQVDQQENDDYNIIDVQENYLVYKNRYSKGVIAIDNISKIIQNVEEK